MGRSSSEDFFHLCKPCLHFCKHKIRTEVSLKGYKNHLDYIFSNETAIIEFATKKEIEYSRLAKWHHQGMNFILCPVLDVTNCVKFGNINARMI